ncbi:MAG: response regulator transcription factor [Caldimonas sp.]
MNVVIADDHPLVRDALARVVLQVDAEARVQAVGDYTALREILAGTLPDLLIVDLNMPGMSGLDALRQLRQSHPSLAIVVASGQDDPPTIRAVLATGANGFVPKSEPPELLIQALKLVRAGGVYIPARTLGQSVDDAGGRDLDLSGLTPRQQDVLRLLQKGEPNKLIARQLGLTEGTVKVHIAAILRALQVRNRTEAVVRASELGFGRSH